MLRAALLSSPRSVGAVCSRATADAFARARQASAAPLDPSHPPGAIILGGLGMTQRALDKIGAALYPEAATSRFTHNLHQIVGVNFRFAQNRARVEAALAASGPGGAVLHVHSGAAFFAVLALQHWAGRPGEGPASRIRGVVLDSVPYLRIERQLMVAAKVPPPLLPLATALVSRLLVSPAVGATVAVTDGYNAAQREARTFAPARRVLVAHSADDVIVPVEQFREHVAAIRARDDWFEAGKSRPDGTAAEFAVYEGRGRHAAMLLDDPQYVGAVQSWVRSLSAP